MIASLSLLKQNIYWQVQVSKVSLNGRMVQIMDTVKISGAKILKELVRGST